VGHTSAADTAAVLGFFEGYTGEGTPHRLAAMPFMAWLGLARVHQVFKLQKGWGRPNGEATLPRLMPLCEGCALSRDMYSQWCNTLAADAASDLRGLVGAVAAADAVWRLSCAARFVQNRTVLWLHLRACAAAWCVP
jgi:hypothetical protein